MYLLDVENTRDLEIGSVAGTYIYRAIYRARSVVAYVSLLREGSVEWGFLRGSCEEGPDLLSSATQTPVISPSKIILVDIFQ
jgi:hypothetical protein